ncbi:MAG: T9SS type A sorting domain-containing protein [Calditrichaeota bacterium]|nr:T9SS type A sorting domain-containing protein [Calditrichota bacterium]
MTRPFVYLSLFSLFIFSFITVKSDNYILSVQPLNPYELAFQEIHSKIDNFAQPSPWKSIGPYNFSGRILAVEGAATNSNILYAGSAGGGLWKSTAPFNDRWEHINLGFPVTSVSAIAVHPEDENIIFVGTGEVYRYQQKENGITGLPFRTSYGIGILKSSDGGKTWQKSLDWKTSDKTAIEDIVFNLKNPNSIIAATSEGLYKSFDCGETWIKVNSNIFAKEIAYFEVDTLRVVATFGSFGSPGTGIYFSIDGGKNWKESISFPDYNGKASLSLYKPPIPLLPAPQIQPPERIYASIADSNRMKGIYFSTKFGSVWQLIAPVDFSGTTAWYSNWIAVNPGNEDEIISTGLFINKSKNNGQSFSGIFGPHAGNNDKYYNPRNPNLIFAATDGGVFRSTNFGNSFNNISYGLVTTQFNKGFSNSKTDSAFSLGGTQRNGTLKYSGTNNWSMLQPVSSATYYSDPDIGGSTIIDPENDSKFYISYDRHQVFKSEDKGLSFRELGQSIDGESGYLTPMVISAQSPKTLYAASNKIFKRTEESQSWDETNDGQPLDGNIITSLQVSPYDKNTVFAATAPVNNIGGLYLTQNAGVSWTKLSNSLPDNLIMDIAFDSKDPNTVYLVYDGFESGHVFRSNDLGNTWEDITANLPDIPTLTILVDPLNNNFLYVGNELGVYVSENKGAEWYAMMDGLPEAIIAMDLTFAEGNRKIRLATHGNGVFETKPVYQPDLFLTSRTRATDDTRLLNYDDTLSFTIDVKNWGKQALAQNYSAQLNIIDSSKNIILSQQSDTCCLQPGKKNTISLLKNYQPPGKGKYTAQFILPDAYNQLTDTVVNNFEIINPTIIKPVVNKIYKPFQRIRSKHLINSTDFQLGLPFSFIYDGYTYDKVMVSEDGFIEFGKTGSNGEFGISGSDERSLSNYSINTENKPAKVIAPWWENLSIGSSFGIEAEISYITEGLAPNRVFVIQWLRIGTPGSSFLNFQVRLYENDYHIEFCYGEALTGLYYGHGAVIGLKDHIGGAYHYFDLTSMDFKNHNQIPTFRSPVSQWPGPDSSYIIRTRTSLDENFNIPEGISLSQPYPNPFNSEITIRYKLPENTISSVKLEIFDVLGRSVKTLTDERQTDGNKSRIWNGYNDQGQNVSSGIYFVSLKVNDTRQYRKIVLIR